MALLSLHSCLVQQCCWPSWLPARTLPSRRSLLSSPSPSPSRHDVVEGDYSALLGQSIFCLVRLPPMLSAVSRLDSHPFWAPSAEAGRRRSRLPPPPLLTHCPAHTILPSR